MQGASTQRKHPYPTPALHCPAPHSLTVVVIILISAAQADGARPPRLPFIWVGRAAQAEQAGNELQRWGQACAQAAGPNTTHRMCLLSQTRCGVAAATAAPRYCLEHKQALLCTTCCTATHTFSMPE